MSERLDKARAAMAGEGLEILVVTGAANRFYLSGFTGDNGILAIKGKEQILFTDFRYIEQAAAEAPEFEIRRAGGPGLLPDFAVWLAQAGGRRIGFEIAHWSLAGYRELIRLVAEELLVPVTGLIERIRMRKEAGEIEKIARAAVLADRAWAALLPSIKAGVRERDLAAELEYQLRRAGADGTSFQTIVASGPRAALPHGVASGRLLQPGEMVVFDFGAVLDGYCSDMTRTVAIGEPGEEMRRIYGVVAEAQALALATLKPGLAGRVVDAAARDRIKTAGYGEYFGHGLGHSVGIEIHEEPRLSVTGETILAPGMVETVEPGIYLPGRGGVRIEDLVVLTEDGYRNLTASPKELLII